LPQNSKKSAAAFKSRENASEFRRISLLRGHAAERVWITKTAKHRGFRSRRNRDEDARSQGTFAVQSR
jgi:hypothetical protein